MKSIIKPICIILSLILLVCNGMVGCSSSSSEDETTTTKDSSSVSAMPPVEGSSYCFDSLEELKAWLTPTDGADAPALNEEGMKYESFRNFVQQITSGKKTIYVPYLGDDIVYIKNPEEYAEICIYSMDKQLRQTEFKITTWIDEQEYWISIFYLSDEEKEYASTHSVPELIKLINPDHPHIGNLQNSGISSYEENISLLERTVPTLYVDIEPDEKGRDYDYMCFVYDDILVRVWARGHEFDKSWLKDLNFQPLP